jgi:DNA helicase-2/ATP-dependent DNA helicase PcrA
MISANVDTPPDANGPEFEVGDQVKHPKWGVGTILFKSGTRDHAKVVVVFPEEGQKKLLVKKARLKKVQ